MGVLYAGIWVDYSRGIWAYTEKIMIGSFWMGSSIADILGLVTVREYEVEAM